MKPNYLRVIFKKKSWHIISPLVWSWLFLIDVARLSNNLFVGYSIIVFAYVVLVGLTSLIVHKAWHWFKPRLKKPSWANVLKIVLVWAAVELFIAWAVSVIWMGRNGNWDNVSPFYSLTPIVAATPLKFLTRMFGYYGTSAVVGAGFIVLISRKFRRYALVYWSVLLVINTGLWLAYRTPDGTSATVTIVSEKLGEPKQVDANNSDFVLLPEYGLDNYTADNIAERFSVNDREVYFSGTKQVNDQQGSLNVLIYGSSSKGFIREGAKSRLITAGEYLPFGLELFLRGVKSPVYDDFMVRRAVVRGHEQLQPFAISDNVVVGNGACSSIINTEDYRKLSRGGANILANSASLEIFRGSRLFGFYHDGFSKFMATANARPFLQSANNWKAFALDHNGNTVANVPPAGTQEVKVRPNSSKTPYSYLGEWVAILGLIFATTQLIGTYKNKRHKLPAKKSKRH